MHVRCIQGPNATCDASELGYGLQESVKPRKLAERMKIDWRSTSNNVCRNSARRQLKRRRSLSPDPPINFRLSPAPHFSTHDALQLGVEPILKGSSLSSKD